MAAVLLAAPRPASADVLPLFNSGVNAAGTPLADGAIDPHYVLAASADPSAPGPDSIVVNSGGFPFPIWAANTSTSKWIGVRADGNLGSPGGVYRFRLTFTLANVDPTTATISGSWAADNSATLELNGVATGLSVATLAALQSFTIPAGSNFVSGQNTLDFVVVNLPGGGGNPTGLQVSALTGFAECTSDASCSAGMWCNDLATPGHGSCQTKTANGAGVPGGACTAPIATRACAAGVCDADDKCGLLNGTGTCGAGNATTVCRSGVCDPDTKCGLAVGDGTCDAGNAATVCRTGTCGAASGKCVPSGGSGCAADGDCAGGQFCNGATFTCATKLANGASLPSDPLHNGGTCTGAVGTAVCASGVCDTDNKCGLANGDGACDSGNAGTVCRSGACSADLKCGLANGEGACNSVNAAVVCRSASCGSSSNKCVPAGGCTIDADCGSGQFCDPASLACVGKLANGAALPNDALHNGGVCNASVAAAVCASGACDLAAGNICGLNLGHGTCASSLQCNQGVCVTSGANSGKCEPCVSDATCGSTTPACDTASNVCVQCTGTNATACSAGTPICNTTTHVCLACNGDNGTAATAACPTAAAPYCGGTGACGKCASNTDCGAGHPGSVCNVTSGACGSLCSTDVDCPGQWCNDPTAASNAGTCTAKIANGQPVPNVAPISGACTAPVGTRVCVSGVCDPGDDLCGQPNGRTCSAAAVCRSGVCNGDGKCGDPNGVACTSAATCRSGVCDGDAKCGASNGEACTADVVCRSGVCQAADGKCGRLNGEACTAAQAAQCRSSVCFSDGACGVPLAQACASGATCRSGACINGACAAACAADADCATGLWCDAVTKACEPAATNGEQPAGSACARGRQCASGVCNADGKCGDPNGTACTGATTCRGGTCVASSCATGGGPGATCSSGLQCLSGVCAADSACGAINATSCAWPSQCRSGICDATGACVTTCASDAECAAPTYCVSGTCAPDGANGQRPGGVACVRGAECLSDVCGADGTCGAANGDRCGSLLVCRSGVCDTVDAKCGLANGDGPCATATAATLCRSAICDTVDAKCGLANGDGPCTTAAQCRSNTCNAATEKCASCVLDTGCPSGSFCDATGGGCAPQLSNGSPCDRPAQCTSAVCDTDNKCGKPDGKPCTTAAQCRTGQCTAGSCGAASDAGAPDAGADAATDAGKDAAADATAPRNDSGTPGKTDGGNPTSDDGSLEGGGVSCAATPGIASNAVAGGMLVLVALAGALRARRRKGRGE